MPPKSSGGFCVENLRSSMVWHDVAREGRVIALPFFVQGEKVLPIPQTPISVKGA